MDFNLDEPVYSFRVEMVRFRERENGKQWVVVERAKGVRRSVTLLGFEIEWTAKRMQEVSQNDQRSDFLGSLRAGGRVLECR